MTGRPPDDALIACSLRAALGDAVRADALVASAQAHAEVTDHDHDEGRGMTWLVFAGTPDAIARAVRAAADAARDVDVGRRPTSAPALGAIDRIRLAPIRGTDVDGCAHLARSLAAELADAHDLPVYLVEAATPPGAERRARVLEERGYAGLRATLATEPTLHPDHGPARLGPMGAARIGAAPLDARFEIDLDGPPGVAARVADALDGRGGGLADVRAGAVARDGGEAVAVRLLAPQRTTLARALAVAEALAPRWAARVLGARLRGCWPRDALWAALAERAALPALGPRDVWETRLPELAPSPPAAAAAGSEGATDPADRTGAEDGTGAGDDDAAGVAATAFAARHAARIGARIAARSAERATGDDGARMAAAAARLEAAIEVLAALGPADRAAYARVVSAYDRPRATIDEARQRRDAIQEALLAAIQVPLGVLRQAADVLRDLRELAARGDAASVADCATASYVAVAAARGAALSVGAQVPGLRDLERGDLLRSESTDLAREAEGLAAAVDGLVRERIRG